MLLLATLPFGAVPVYADVDWPLVWELYDVTLTGTASKTAPVNSDPDLMYSYDAGVGFFNSRIWMPANGAAEEKVYKDQKIAWSDPPETISVGNESQFSMSFQLSGDRGDAFWSAFVTDFNAYTVYMNDDGTVDQIMDEAYGNNGTENEVRFYDEDGNNRDVAICLWARGYRENGSLDNEESVREYADHVEYHIVVGLLDTDCTVIYKYRMNLNGVTFRDSASDKETDTETETEKRDDIIDVEAKDTEGETEVGIEDEIIEGKTEKKESKKKSSSNTENTNKKSGGSITEDQVRNGVVGGTVAAVVGGVGAVVAATGGTQGGGKKNGSQKDPKYRLKVKKDFGNVLCPGEDHLVYARIVQVDPETGAESDRADLSSAIQIFCEDNAVSVQPGSMTEVYKSAMITAASGNTKGEALVCFRYQGVGGSFTTRMRFRVPAPILAFDQPNIALPHDLKEAVKPYFVTVGIDPKLPIIASVTPEDAFDINIIPGEDVKVDGCRLYYAAIIPKNSLPSMEEREPGSTDTYILKLEAKEGETVIAETEIQIFRVRTGLTVSTKFVRCYWEKTVSSEKVLQRGITEDEYYSEELLKQAKDKEGLRQFVVRKTKPAETETELKLIYYDEETEDVRTVAPIPIESSLKWTAIEPEEQDRLDKVHLVMDFGKEYEFGEEGGLKVKLVPRQGGLDAPNRIKAKLHIEATAFDKTFSCDKEVTVLRQPPRWSMSLEEFSAATKEDERIGQRLEHLKMRIKKECYQNLFPVSHIIQSMLDDYDPEYGYDPEQVALVINTYNFFCRGQLVGANAELPDKENLLDYMLWAIDATGEAADTIDRRVPFIARFLLGVASFGATEAGFRVLDFVRVPYRMKQALERGHSDVKLFGMQMGSVDSDSVLGCMVAGAHDIVMGEVQGRLTQAALGAGWNLSKNYAMKSKVPMIKNGGELMTTLEKGYLSAAEKYHQKYDLNSDFLGRNFRPKGSVDTLKKGAAEIKATRQQVEMEVDARIKAYRAKQGLKDGVDGPDGLVLKEMPDGSTKVVGIERMDPATAASYEGYAKVIDYKNKLNQWMHNKTPETSAALENAALAVREDLIAGWHMKNFKGPDCLTVKAEYTRNIRMKNARIDAIANEGIAARTGTDVSKIYCRSVTTGGDNPYDPGMDYDQTRMKIEGNGKADVEVDPQLQFEENAKAAYEVYTGKEATNLKEAIEVAERYQNTTVAGERGNPLAREKYGDVEGMLTKAEYGKALKNVQQSADAMQYKVDLYEQQGIAKMNEAAKYVKGSAEARAFEVEAQRCFHEADRAAYKQFDRTLEQRNNALILNGKGNRFTQKDNLTEAILRRFFEGKEGIRITRDEMRGLLEELGVTGEELGRMMNELTYRVADGD